MKSSRHIASKHLSSPCTPLKFLISDPNIFYVLLQVVDIDTGETLGAGKSGELLMKTPSLMTGYRNKPEATAEAIDKDGWFHTGKELPKNS